jgi:hypothetical protein
MNPKRRNGLRAVAAFLLFSITQISLQVGLATNATAIPQQFVARLTTRNNQPITVNGLSATTGASVLTGATIETGADQSATINLGPLGSLDIAPNTKVVLTFDDQRNVKASVVYGCVILRAKKATTGEVTTEQGSAGKTDPATGGVLDVCSPQGAAPIVNQGAASAAGAGVGSSTAPAAAGGGGLFGLGKAATIAIFAGIGAASLTPLAFQDNPSGSAP